MGLASGCPASLYSSPATQLCGECRHHVIRSESGLTYSCQTSINGRGLISAHNISFSTESQNLHCNSRESPLVPGPSIPHIPPARYIISAETCLNTTSFSALTALTFSTPLLNGPRSSPFQVPNLSPSKLTPQFPQA
jgi:hypothetical protein